MKRAKGGSQVPVDVHSFHQMSSGMGGHLESTIRVPVFRGYQQDSGNAHVAGSPGCCANVFRKSCPVQDNGKPIKIIGRTHDGAPHQNRFFLPVTILQFKVDRKAPQIHRLNLENLKIIIEFEIVTSLRSYWWRS
jgi:hypothetical protein